MLYSLKICFGYPKPIHSLYITYTFNYKEFYLEETHIKWKPLLYTILTLNLFILLIVSDLVNQDISMAKGSRKPIQLDYL